MTKDSKLFVNYCLQTDVTLLFNLQTDVTLLFNA